MPDRGAPRTLTTVRGVRLGHAEGPGARTGVTCLVFDRPAPTVVDVRGGASGTFDTASLALDATFGLRSALFFAGGSLFGLDAARGVRERLLEEGKGVEVFGNPHRIVPISGAILFDLPGRGVALPDYRLLGRDAVRRASRGPVPLGRRGAGAGALVGKYLGRKRAAPGGVGSASEELATGGAVGVLVVLNSVGAVRDPSTGRWLAGPTASDGSILPPGGGPRDARRARQARGTTLVAVVVDAPMGREVLQRLCVAAHDGLARSIVPCHTPYDGDVVFASGTARGGAGRPREPPGAVADRTGPVVTRLVERSVLRAVGADGSR
ncbi:MAG TPA: P1 family peptidase [Thermoplasmata archaeon]|nr:P1 family peptidase [Thermoplasmata archaeon]